MPMTREIANTIVDPEAYADWNRLHDAFAELRRSSPLAVAEADDFDPFWVVTRHEDVRTVEFQNELFLNEPRPAILTSREEEATIREATGGSPNFVRTLVQMDNPDHANYRRLTQSWFVTKNLAKIEARVRDLANRTVETMLDQAGSGGEVDFASDVAFHYPLRTIMTVMGVPESEEGRMLKLTQELFGASDSELGRDGAAMTGEERANAMRTAVMDIFGMFGGLVEERRQDPKEDLVTLLSTATIDGEPIGDFERMSYFAIVATAGHDTTAATISSTLWALAERPELFAQMRNDLALLPSLIEEATRWETPVKHFMRTAAEDVEVAGVKIAKGDWLMLAYLSANRDESIFDNPFEFDPSRAQAKHLAYGYGPHVCLGQYLARMEMRLLWEALLPKLKSVELAGKPTRSSGSFVNGPKSVPIRLKAA